MFILVWKVTALPGDRLECTVGVPLVPGVGEASFELLRPLCAVVEPELDDVWLFGGVGRKGELELCLALEVAGDGVWLALPLLLAVTTGMPWPASG